MNNNVIRRPAKVLPSPANGASSTAKTPFLDSSSAAIVLPFPSAGELAGANGKKLSVVRVTAAGRVVTGGTHNFTIALQWGTSATAADNTDISNSGTVSLASLTTNWMVEATLIVDNDSGRVTGWCRNLIHATLEAIATLDNTISSIDPDGNSTYGLVVTQTFGTSHASNAAYLDVFQLEMVG